MFNRQNKLTELQVHQRKLTDLIGELLKRADDIDRQSKDGPSNLTLEWHDKFAQVCQEIVTLSQAVDGINDLIRKGDLKATEKAMSRSADIAKHLWTKLQELSTQAS